MPISRSIASLKALRCAEDVTAAAAYVEYWRQRLSRNISCFFHKSKSPKGISRPALSSQVAQQGGARIAANIAKLPELLRKPWSLSKNGAWGV
jgi:hypothetical protein